MADIVKAGSVYETDSRKGKLTLRLLTDVDLREDAFFDAEIIEGRAGFASISGRAAQRAEGLGTTGTVLSFRTTLTHFTKRRRDLENKE